MIRCALMLILLPMLAFAAPDEDAAPPFTLPTPDGWLTETIPFPLGFAPDLAYEGLEELRFAPGMFKQDQDDFWTYAFVWWIGPESVVTPEILARDLVTYFEGLAAAVADGKEIDMSAAQFSCHLEATDSLGKIASRFQGEAVTFDAFASLQNVTLNLKVRVQPCALRERRAVIFELSPQPYSHAVWDDLASIRRGFRCAAP